MDRHADSMPQLADSVGGTEAFTTYGVTPMPSPVRYAVVRAMLESHGWSLDRVRGSHFIFSKPGEASTVVPVHRGQVKYGYFRKVKKLVGEAEGE